MKMQPSWRGYCPDKKDLRECSLISAMWGYNETTAISGSESEPSPDTVSAVILMDFPAFETVRNKCCLSASLYFCYGSLNGLKHSYVKIYKIYREGDF